MWMREKEKVKGKEGEKRVSECDSHVWWSERFQGWRKRKRKYCASESG